MPEEVLAGEKRRGCVPSTCSLTRVQKTRLDRSRESHSLHPLPSFPLRFLPLFISTFSGTFFFPFSFACAHSIVEWGLLSSLAANAVLYQSTREDPLFDSPLFPSFPSHPHLFFLFIFRFFSLLANIVPPLARKKAASPNGVLFQISSLPLVDLT
jgi:hypothetical protein